MRKAIDLVEHERRPSRGGGKVRPLADLADAEAAALLGPEPPPDLVAQFEDQCRRLLKALPADELRSVAVWRLEGYTNDEIAARLGCVVQTVERKLRRIRTIWSEKGDT